MMAALVKLMLTSSCLLYVKQNRGIEGRTKKDETSQIRGMKGPLLEQNSSYWATLALYSPGIWNPYSLFKSLF